jgi:hypothetical protein
MIVLVRGSNFEARLATSKNTAQEAPSPGVDGVRALGHWHHWQLASATGSASEGSRLRLGASAELQVPVFILISYSSQV